MRNLWVSLGPTGSGKSFLTEKLISNIEPFNEQYNEEQKTIKDLINNINIIHRKINTETPISETSIKSCFLDDLIENDELYKSMNTVLIQHFFLNTTISDQVSANEDSSESCNELLTLFKNIYCKEDKGCSINNNSFGCQKAQMDKDVRGKQIAMLFNSVN